MLNDTDSLLGTQLVLISGLKLVLMQYRDNPSAIAALKYDLERTRSLILGTSLSEQTLAMFNEVANELVRMIEPEPTDPAQTSGATPA